MDLRKLSKVADSHNKVIVRKSNRRIKDSVDLNSVGFYEKLDPETLNSAVYAEDYHHETKLIKTKSVIWCDGHKLDYLEVATLDELPERVREYYELAKKNYADRINLPDWDETDTSFETLLRVLEELLESFQHEKPLVLEPGLWMVSDEIFFEAYKIECMADWFFESIEDFTIEESANVSIDTLNRWLEEAHGDERENLELYIENNYE